MTAAMAYSIKSMPLHRRNCIIPLSLLMLARKALEVVASGERWSSEGQERTDL